MNELKIYGYSDDCLEIDGQITEEFNPDTDGPFFLVFSEGTVLRGEYGDEGTWRFHRIIKGLATYEHQEADPEADESNYTDIVTLRLDETAGPRGFTFVAMADKVSTP